MQTLALLHTVQAAGRHADWREPEPVLRELSPAADAAYAAGVRALLAHEAALQRGTAAIRCIRISVLLCPSHAQRVMCRLLLAANRFNSMCLCRCLLTVEVKCIAC